MRRIPFTLENIKAGNVFRYIGDDYLITKVSEDNPYTVELLDVSIDERYRGTVYHDYTFNPVIFTRPNASLWSKDSPLTVEEML